MVYKQIMKEYVPTAVTQRFFLDDSLSTLRGVVLDVEVVHGVHIILPVERSLRPPHGSLCPRPWSIMNAIQEKHTVLSMDFVARSA